MSYFRFEEWSNLFKENGGSQSFRKVEVEDDEGK